MNLNLKALWSQMRESMWFLPLVLVLAGFWLAVFMVWIDARFGEPMQEWLPLSFAASADAGRQVLSTIAGAMASVVGIAFSITIVVLQLASAQYSPRVLTTFRKDRGQQWVLGVYLATFAYALVVVRQVRGEEASGGRFVPGLAILVGVGLAVLSLVLLVYFVHHVSEVIRAAHITDRIRREVLYAYDRLYPEPLEGAGDDDEAYELVEAQLAARPKPPQRVLSELSGFVQLISVSDLEALHASAGGDLRLRVSVGAYVFQDDCLLEVHNASEPVSEAWCRRARQAFVFGYEPTVEQDPLFGLRQLADIALRALSPGVNDPTTAEQALLQLGDCVAVLSQRALPSSVRRVEGRLMLVPRPTFAAHVAGGFDQIRRAAREDVHVLGTLLRVLERIAERGLHGARALAVLAQLEAVERGLTEKAVPDPVERGRLEALVLRVRSTLDRPEVTPEAAESGPELRI